MQAAQVYPVAMTSGAGYHTASQTRCTTSYGVTNCTTMPGSYVAGAQTDSNLIPRIGFHMSCLQGRGYTRSR